MGGLQRFDLIILYNNICMWFGQNFCLKILRRPSNPAKILGLPEDYKTDSIFYFVIFCLLFFLYYYKQTVLHLASPSFLSTFKDNNCNFLVLRLFTGCFLTLSWPDYCPFSLATELYCFNMLSPIESY